MVGDRRGSGRDESGLGEGVSLGSWGAGLRLCLGPESVGSTFRCQVDLEHPERDIGGQALCLTVRSKVCKRSRRSGWLEVCVGVSEHLQFNVYARASVSPYMCMHICGYSCVYVCKCDVTVICLCCVPGWIDMPLSVTTCALCFSPTFLPWYPVSMFAPTGLSRVYGRPVGCLLSM